MYDIILAEAEIRECCASKEHKTKCRAYRRFVEEATSTIVKREPEDESAERDQAESPGPESAAPESPDAEPPAPD